MLPTLSLIVNTCAHQLHPDGTGELPLDREKLPLVMRDRIVHDLIIPQARLAGVGQIIIVGQFLEPHEDNHSYRYINVPPKYRDARDAPMQRHIGAEEAIGDILIFMNDDHYMRKEAYEAIRERYKPGSSITPARFRRDYRGVVRIENGEKTDGKEAYIAGHVNIVDRTVLSKVPWEEFADDVSEWDRVMTTRLASAAIHHEIVDWCSCFDAGFSRYHPTELKK